MNYLGQLIGKKMFDLVEYRHGSTAFFEGGIKLAIFNPFEVNKKNGSRGVLKRCIVVSSAIERDEVVKIGFLNDDIFLTINMSDRAYSGPESLILDVPGQAMVVRRLGE